MLTYLRTLLALAAVAPLSLASAVVASPGDASHAWVEAARQNTVAGYADFAMTYPDSVFAAEARRRISGNRAPGEDPVSMAAWSPSRVKTIELVPDIIRIY